MTKTQQRKFVAEVLAYVKKAINTSIGRGRIPDNWEGVELRKMMAEKVKATQHGSMVGKRLEAYQNDMIVNNI